MRTLILLSLGSLFILSCGKPVTCSNPSFTVYIYGFDTTIKIKPYEIKTYQKGTNYTVLVDSVSDTAKLDSIGTGRQITILGDVDYLIYFPLTNVTHKIENITRTELTGVREPFGNTSGGSCSVRKCFNSLSYSLDGVYKSVGGYSGCYDLHISAKEDIK